MINEDLTHLQRFISTLDDEIRLASESQQNKRLFAGIFLDYLNHCLSALLSSTSCTPFSVLLYPYSPTIRTNRLPRPIPGSLAKSNKEIECSAHTSKLEYHQLKQITAKQLAKHTAEGFSLFHGLYQSNNETPGKKIKINPGTTHPYIESIREIALSKQHLFYGLYTHGSYATGDFINEYSDFDATWIIDKNTCMDTTSLMAARKLLMEIIPYVYSFDQQQHHELFVLSEYSFDLYNEARHAITLWNEARVIAGTEEIEIKQIEKNTYGKLLAFLQLEKSILCFITTHEWDNWYSTKNMIQQLALLPALYYQFQGIDISKSEAITSFTKQFGLTPVNTTTRIRELWKDYSLNLSMQVYRTGLKFNPQLARIMISLKRKTPQWIIRELGEDFAANTVHLLQTLNLSIHNNARISPP
jgi:hypothetical protein